MTVPVIADALLTIDWEARIQEAKMQNDGLMKLMSELLKDGVDYGKVKGVARPFLHQPGAQQLALVFQFAPKFVLISSTIAFERDPIFISYEFKCELYHRDRGTFLGEGVGAANNYERKYRYRTDYKTREKVDFEDPLDYQNTILKMAKKRAYVDAICNVTGASRLFASEEDLLEPTTPGEGNGEKGDPGETLVPFGKNKDKPLKELSTPDIQWLMSKAKSDKLKADCEAVLKHRLEKEVEEEKIDADTGKKILEYVNSKDEAVKGRSREIVLQFVQERGFNEIAEISKLKKSEGVELLKKLETENKAVA